MFLLVRLLLLFRSPHVADMAALFILTVLVMMMMMVEEEVVVVIIIIIILLFINIFVLFLYCNCVV